MVKETQRGAKMTRCGIYSRVSTTKQEADNQLVQLREFARTMGWQVVGEYVDQITGKHSDRPEFQRMFSDASQRRFDVLLFWSLDRLSREGALETLQHLNRLTGYGIQWRSLTEQYLDSTGMFREAVISILAVVAKQERIHFQPCLEHAGLRRFRFHDMRHTFGSLLIQDGASLAYVRDQMGHSSIQVTVDTYGHLIPGANINWVDGLDRETSPEQNATQAQPELKSEKEPEAEPSEVILEPQDVGERGRNRTFNLLIKSQLLCQLSYAPGKGLPIESTA